VTREVTYYGDSGLILETGSAEEARRLAEAVGQAQIEGVEDLVVGERSLTVLVGPATLDMEALADELRRTSPAPDVAGRRRAVEIPVVFDGPDLADAARRCSMTERELVQALTTARLEVLFMGFAPGFAYMVGLPPPLDRLERRATPRPRVEAGAFAVGGGYAAIYPRSSPGGWNLLGRTSMPLFSPEEPPYAVLAIGDEIRLVVAESVGEVGGPADATDTGRPLLNSSAERSVQIVSPGMCSLVEDLGRSGVAGIGVPKAGAADTLSLRLANRLLGNDDASAAIEITGSGPSVRVVCESEVLVAVVGDAEARVGETTLPPNTVFPLAPGQTLVTGSTRRGLRAYLAFDGGIDLPPLMGSRSSDVLCGLGPGPLRAGDVLGLAPSSRARGRLFEPPSSLKARALRVLAGPDDLGTEALQSLLDREWSVSADSDRVGVRLSGEPLFNEGTQIPSRATVTGAIQVPGDGLPIALLCDHATVGGYPVVATVARADLSRLGQLRPGDDVRFELVDLRSAATALVANEREIDSLVAAWYPVRVQD
jgi:KipI family sensor histidine kinase inhibitor